MKILLIDDEQLDLFIVEKQLSQEFEVKGFATEQQSLAWASGNSFDIALIDYYLGEVSGLEMLDKLIALKGADFKAFLLTNYIDASQVEEMKSKGFHDVIFKPITLEKLKSYLSASAHSVIG